MENKKYSKLKTAFEATQPQAPADFTERVMKRIKEQPSVFQSKRRWVWLYPTITAVAASILLLLTFHTQDPESSGLQPQNASQAAETPAWQYEDERTIRDAYFAHQKEIQEKGERLAAYIQQQITVNIE